MNNRTLRQGEMPKELKKPSFRERINNWIGMFLYRRIGVKAGPFMFHSRGEWWFIDHYGSIWIIRYTGSFPTCPLQITLFHRV
jgi:hypothetical protein